jgi:hypothetical protein
MLASSLFSSVVLAYLTFAAGVRFFQMNYDYDGNRGIRP